MEKKSIWQKTTEMPQFQKLRHDIQTDVLVIGGGIAGILCAYHLQQAGVDYVLVEADRICSGITKKTTAKVTSQHGLIYHKIARRYGIDAARLYFEANERALEKYRGLSERVDCDFSEQPNYVYTVDQPQLLEREMKVLQKIGATSELVTSLPLPFAVAGAVCFPHQAQFHPLKFLAEISKGLRIYEHTKVLELMAGKAVTECGTITAEKIIVATHFPMLNKHGMYFLKMYQHRSYVLALENIPKISGMYVDDDEKGMSFRGYNGMLFVGGGSHRTGKQGGNWRELRMFCARHYPYSSETACWATQDCMTLDGLPYIGRYSKSVENLYVATGFNKWGMSTSMAAAELLTDLILERDTPDMQLYSPQRTMLHPQLLLNGAEAVKSILTPTLPRCPHMGCALKYNKQEHSWDCPCHGSRFTREGALIDNPATDDMK